MRVIRLLKKHYPDAHCALDHESPEQLLVATVLSAQCTDERVNMVTPELFRRYPTMEKMAKAEPEELENLIRSTGFFRNKAKNLRLLAEKLVKNYSGKVPREMEQLTELPGVGRKTANVVLGNSFGMATGVVVDTHVFRISRRLGFSSARQPEAVERDLMKLVPQDEWVQFSHWLITLGRQICKARSPNCKDCFLLKECPQKMG